jgi:arylsulfatase A-like enzyme
MSGNETNSPPSALVFAALGGGMAGGALVGIGEALYVLGSTRPAEYQALLYGAVLYGLIGAGMGLAIGVPVALLTRIRRVELPTAWALGFHGVLTALGAVILRYLVNKAVYAEQGVPMPTMAGIGLGLLLLAAVGLWFWNVVLTKTPLRVLPRPKGTIAAAVGGTGLVAIFSLAPAPGAQGDMAPKRPQAPGFAEKPDVYVLFVDTLRADALGVYGAPETASPRLDALARDAVVFEQHITSASWTRASTASFLTSLSPSSHTCETKDSALPQMVETVAEAFSKSGYATGGLPNNANVTGSQGFDQGFDWFPYQPEYPLGAKESTYALSMYSVVRKIYTKIDTKKRVESYYMPAETQFARAQQFIDANGGDRHFLFVHLMEPHDPYFAHPWTGEAYGRAEFPNPDPGQKDRLRELYAGEVAHVDAQIGAFVDSLKAQGRYDNAVIVVTADHGEEFLEHGGWWHGTTLYDEQVRVPLIMKLPKNARAGTRVPWQVRQIDVAPTLLELADFEVPSAWQGSMLFDDNFDADVAKMQPPVVEADVAGEGAQADAAAAVAEVVPAAPAVPQWVAPTWANHPASREALSEQDFEGYDLQALRTGGHKVIQALRVPAGNPRNQPEVAAYDLLADPGESTDVAGKGESWEAAVTARMQTIVQQKQEVRVAAEGVEVSDAERARLEALGYIQADVPAEGTGEQK